MLTLLYIGVVFAVPAVAVTIYAVMSAKDGFEDELGFHAISPTGTRELSGLAESAAPETSTDGLPPMAAAS